jgi:hypothetical protein
MGCGISVTPRPLFYARERPGAYCTGGWVGPRAGVDRCGKSRSHRDSIPGRSSPYPVAIPTELPSPHDPEDRARNIISFRLSSKMMFLLVVLMQLNTECLRVRNFKFPCSFHPPRSLLFHQDSRHNSVLSAVIRLRDEQLALRPRIDFSSLLTQRLPRSSWSVHPLGNKSDRIIAFTFYHYIAQLKIWNRWSENQVDLITAN